MSSNSQVIIRESIKQEYDEKHSTMPLDKFFQVYTTQLIFKSFDLDYDELEEGITDGSNDGGCDGVYLFVNDEIVCENDDSYTKIRKDAKISLYIIQSKNTETFGESVLEKWKTASENLLDLDAVYSKFGTRYNANVLGRFDLFRKTYINLVRKISALEIKYVYIANGVEIHPNVQAQADELKEITRRHFPTANVSVVFQGANELIQMMNAPANSTFFLKHTEAPISSSGQVYVLLVQLPDYYKFITDENGELIKHIFESNVRDYQGHVKVNHSIQETLISNLRKEDFWWLNNGVTILAASVLPAPPRQLKIESPEIVNGLQTSTEIYNYFDLFPQCLDSDTRCILVRVIVPENDESRDRIILATNNQTTIPKSSLRATDVIHRQIEMYFKTHELFYDRRKNYYKNIGKPAEQIVSISFLSQCLMATLLSKPDFARARPSTLLSDDVVYKKLFNPKHNLTVYYNLAYIGKKIIMILRKCGNYNLSDISNIQFYVLYYVIGRAVGDSNIDAKGIQNMDIKMITEDNILAAARTVYDVYTSKGGNDKLAKGSELIVAVTSLLNAELAAENA